VVSVEEKVETKISAGMDQKDERKRTAVEVSKFQSQHQNRGSIRTSG